MWYIFNLRNIKQNNKKRVSIYSLQCDISVVVSFVTIDFISVKQILCQGIIQNLHERTDYCMLDVEVYVFSTSTTVTGIFCKALSMTTDHWNKMAYTHKEILYSPAEIIGTNNFYNYTHLTFHICDALKETGIDMILNKIPESIITRINVSRPRWPRTFYSRLTRVTVRNYSNKETSVWNIRHNICRVRPCSSM
jgi:hypothetical protein